MCCVGMAMNGYIGMKTCIITHKWIRRVGSTLSMSARMHLQLLLVPIRQTLYNY